MAWTWETMITTMMIKICSTPHRMTSNSRVIPKESIEVKTSRTSRRWVLLWGLEGRQWKIMNNLREEVEYIKPNLTYPSLRSSIQTSASSSTTMARKHTWYLLHVMIITNTCITKEATAVERRTKTTGWWDEQTELQSSATILHRAICQHRSSFHALLNILRVVVVQRSRLINNNR